MQITKPHFSMAFPLRKQGGPRAALHKAGRSDPVYSKRIACYYQAQRGVGPEAQPLVKQSSLKILGVGSRGISSTTRLIESGRVKDAEFWGLDGDRKVLISAADRLDLVEIQGYGDDGNIVPEDLHRISEGALRIGGHDPVECASGAVFILGSAAGSPGGAATGARKLEQADALIEAVEDVAHLVVVVDQNVLTRASSEMTMADASAIADNTLLYTVRSILWALKAPELLVVTNGCFVWHGKDMRTGNRGLFPPTMSMLACPGHGNLGRGQAGIPMSTLQQAGLPSTLSTLAEDAVRAASESPFLADKMSTATAVLCIIKLPPSIAGRGHNPYISNISTMHRDYALRSAIQVAAMTVREIAGPSCKDIVVCPHIKDQSDDDDGYEDPSVLSIECALLVVEAIGGTAGSPATFSRDEYPWSNQSPSSSASRSASSSRSSRQTPTPTVLPGDGYNRYSQNYGQDQGYAPSPSYGQSQGYGQGQSFGQALEYNQGQNALAEVPLPSQQLGSSRPSWSAMSMIAGGSATAAQNLQSRRVNRSPGQGPRQPSPPRRAPSYIQSDNGSSNATREQHTPKMPENPVTSLVAQSLDLPPTAAKWRHQYRAQGQPAVQHRRRYDIPAAGNPTQQADNADDDGSESKSSNSPVQKLFGLVQGVVSSPGSNGAAVRPANLRTRVAGMLDRDRGYK